MDKYIKCYKRIYINEVNEHFWSSNELYIKSTSSVNIAEDFIYSGVKKIYIYVKYFNHRTLFELYYTLFFDHLKIILLH